MTAIETLAKALASQDVDDNLQAAKEKARQKQAPFKTKFDPHSPKTLDELKGWRPPGGVSGDDAYILFEKKMIERGDRAPDTVVYTLHTLLVGSRPEQVEKVRYNVQVKGMRVIHWDRFPKTNDPNPRRAKLADMHFNPITGKTAYDSLEEILLYYATGKGSNSAELQAQLQAAESEIKSLQDKLNKKRSDEEKGKEKDKEPQK